MKTRRCQDTQTSVFPAPVATWLSEVHYVALLVINVLKQWRWCRSICTTIGSSWFRCSPCLDGALISSVLVLICLQEVHSIRTAVFASPAFLIFFSSLFGRDDRGGRTALNHISPFDAEWTEKPSIRLVLSLSVENTLVYVLVGTLLYEMSMGRRTMFKRPPILPAD